MSNVESETVDLMKVEYSHYQKLETVGVGKVWFWVTVWYVEEALGHNCAAWWLEEIIMYHMFPNARRKDFESLYHKEVLNVLRDKYVSSDINIVQCVHILNII